VLAVGWFGFNVMSAQTIDKISGLVAVNSLMAMVGGTLVAVLLGRNDPGFAYNGPLAGLVAVCAGSVVVHAVGGWVALPAILLLGARRGRYTREGKIAAHPPSSIPFLALGAWILTVGWFGFNVMSAQTLDKMNGLVAVNSLMALVGGTLSALVLGRNDPGFAYNGPLAGLVAVCAGSDLMHPLGALATGAVAGTIFVLMFTWTQNKWKIDDVLGVWPLHGLCGAWGGLAAGIFGSKALGGLGHVSFMSQLSGTLLGIAIAMGGGAAIYGLIKVAVGLRLDPEEEYDGADLSIHKISANPEADITRH
jgi:Amt family ammonium transporter